MRPKVLLIGGPDVDCRLPLMRRLADEFDMAALGSAELGATFSAAGFAFANYPLHRGINPLADLRTISRLRARIRQIGPDIVHTFDSKPGVFGCIAARREKVPVVLGTVTGLGSLYASSGAKNRIVRSIYERLQRAACRRSDLTIFQNHDDVRQLVAAGVVDEAATKVILGSGVETDRFAPHRVGEPERAALRQELGLARTEAVVTMIARVTRTKGVLEFVAAARALQAKFPQARFLLIGPSDTESLDRLREAELQQLRATLIWPGARRDVPAILAITDVFVLPTAYREGIPRVLLEAAAMGLPLVTTDSPGCNEVVRDGHNGILMQAGDVRGLTEAIARLLADPALRQRFGAISRERAVTLFDLGVVARQTSEVYRRLLTAKALRPAAPDRA